MYFTMISVDPFDWRFNAHMSDSCIFEMAASICVHDISLNHLLLHGPNRGEFIVHKGAISPWRARPTAIVVPLV